MLLLTLVTLPYLIPHIQVVGESLEVRVASDENLTHLQVWVDPVDTTLKSRDDLPYRDDAAWEFWDRENRSAKELVLRFHVPAGHYRLQVAATRENGERIHSRWYAFSWDGKVPGPALDLGPYLFYPAPDTAAIRTRWVNARRAYVETPETRVDLRPTGEFGFQEARIPVRAGSILRYRVCGDGAFRVCSGWYDAQTPPFPGYPVVFGALGDTRSGWLNPASTARMNLINVPVLRLLVHVLYREGAQALFVLGDLVHGYTEDTTFVCLQYETWLQATEPVSGLIPLFPVVGNHDATAPFVSLEGRNFRWREGTWAPERVWAKFFVLPENGPRAGKEMPPYRENVYAARWGDVVFVALNSDYRYERLEGQYTARRVDETQRRWLQDVLEDLPPGVMPVVGVHEPLFPTSRHVGRSLDAWPEDRDALLEILRKFRVPVVFSGHEHLYARLVIPGEVPVVQIITGRGGSPLYRDILEPLKVPYLDWVKARSADEHGVLCEVRPPHLSCRVVNTAGFAVDAFAVDRP